METKRLRLLPPTMERQPLILEAIKENQNDLGAYLSWDSHSLTESKLIEQTQQAINNFKYFENDLRYSIIEKSSGDFIGEISVILRNKAVNFFEIGYWLRSSSVGFGFMTEAVTVVEKYVFLELNARRIDIKVAAKNIKSRAVAERCGYQFEGVLHNHYKCSSGEFSHTAVYAKTCF